MAGLVALIGTALVTGVLRVGEAAPRWRATARPEVPVTSMDQTLTPANNSPVLVPDPTEPRFVVLANRVDAPDFSCALQVSGNGGRGWVSAQPVPKLPSGADKCYAPEAAFDRAGKLYYLFVGLTGAGNEPMGAFLTTSTDRARTFTPPRQVLGPANFAVRMAIDPNVGANGRIHLVWLHATSDPPLGGFGPPPNPILAAHSDDGGRTFSRPVLVSDRARQRVVAPALALSPDGGVHVAYYDLQADAVDYQGLEGPVWQGTWSVVLASSADGGRRFPPGVVVDSSIVPPERVMLIFTMPPPALAADRRRICVAWTDARHGDADALARCTRGQGRSWTTIRRLNDDAIGNGRRQHLPHLSLSTGGRLDAVFYDRRADPQNLRNDVFYTFSNDGGQRFSRNVRLTGDPSDARIGQQYVNVSAQGQVEFGSRLALMSRKNAALAAWPDTRNSRPFTTGQDLFAAEVNLVRRGSERGMVRGVGVALAVGGVLTIVALAFRWPRGSLQRR